VGFSVRFVIFKLHDCAATTAAAISLARIALCFGEREVIHCGHDLMCRRPSIGPQSPERFAKTMWLTLQVGNAGSFDCVAHPPTEAIDREWFSVFGGDDAKVNALQGGESLLERYGFLDRDGNSRFLSRVALSAV
jgi:hypothetical protein